jgi:hypothetical protein
MLLPVAEAALAFGAPRGRPVELAFVMMDGGSRLEVLWEEPQRHVHMRAVRASLAGPCSTHATAGVDGRAAPWGACAREGASAEARAAGRQEADDCAGWV